MNHPTLGSSSTPILSRSASHILRIYRQLAGEGLLNPCWVQLQRILTCIHLIILTYSAGHTHESEAKELIDVGVEFVRKHEACWEPAKGLTRDLEKARLHLFGIGTGIGIGDEVNDRQGNGGENRLEFGVNQQQSSALGLGQGQGQVQVQVQYRRMVGWMMIGCHGLIRGWIGGLGTGR